MRYQLSVDVVGGKEDGSGEYEFDNVVAVPAVGDTFSTSQSGKHILYEVVSRSFHFNPRPTPDGQPPGAADMCVVTIEVKEVEED